MLSITPPIFASFSYKAGIIEQEWLPPVKNRLCQIARRKSQTDATPLWISFATDARGSTPRAPFDNESVVLSKFVGRDACEEHIEPLTGIARHPLAPSMGCKGRWNLRKPPISNMPRDKYNIGYLIPANHCGEGQHGRGTFGYCRHISTAAVPSVRGRNLYYDLGASVWGRPMKEAEVVQGSGLGSSLQLFVNLYKRNCIEFDRIWAWEARSFKPTDWWRYVPRSVRAKLHFFNIPISEKSDGDGASMLGMLKETATPEDFVVVKVDIDTPDLEKMIVKTIATTPSLAALVDELFFEYHFHFGADARGPWGETQNVNKSQTDTYLPDTVDDALGLMRQLREAGIRAHFWV